MSAVLKLGMAVPNHAQKWVRVKNKNSPKKTKENPIFSSSSFSSLSLNAIKSSTTTNSIHFTPTTTAIYRKVGPCWRRITPCALSAHVSRLPRSLGLSFSSSSSSSSRHHSNCNYNKFSECHSLSSFSSENRGELSSSSLSSSPSSSSSSASESVMGSENLKPREPNQNPKQNHNNGRRLQSSSPSSKVLTLPTILTLGRVAAVPLLIGTFYVDSWWAPTATTSIFIAAAFTDWLDGYLARRMKLGTAFGAFLDPVADKLMVAATLVLLCTKPMDFGVFGQVPWLLTVPAIAIIAREITMSAVREWAASQNTKLLEAVAVNNLGKWKTATQMIALTILLATRDHSLSGPDFLVACGVVLLYISAGLAVWSLGVYMSKIWKVLMK